MQNTPSEGSEKRTFFRVSYQPAKRPKLTLGPHEFEIADISEGAIRFINSQKIKLAESVRGTAHFLSGASMDIEANIVWEQFSKVGLLLKTYIPPAIMEKEKQHVILNSLK
jgi:hypothetical protein